MLWRRGDEERSAPAAGFTGTSPAYAVATARLLRLAVGERRRVALVAVTEPALATRAVGEGWALTGVEQRDGVEVARYEVADLATGDRWVVQLADDLVVQGDGVTVADLPLA